MSPPSLAFTFPSRSGGREHVVQVDADSLRPRACTCLAWQHRRLCWAVVAEDLPSLARQRWAAARRRRVALEELAERGRTSPPTALPIGRWRLEVETIKARGRAA